MTTPEQLATIDEVARFFRTSPAAIYTQRSRGEAPGSLGVKVGRRILFDRDVLKDWMKNQAGQKTASWPG